MLAISLSPAARAQDSSDDLETSVKKPLATSGSMHLNSVELNRQRFKHKAVAELIVNLGFIYDKEPPGGFVMHKTELKRLLVRDDLGTELTQIDLPTDDDGDSLTPFYHLHLTVPPRNATRLKQFSGQFVVTRWQAGEFAFGDLPSLLNKPLRDEDLKGWNIIPRAVQDRDMTIVTLTLPVGPRKILRWNIESLDDIVCSDPEQQEKDGVVVHRIKVEGKITKRWGLYLNLSIPFDTKTFDFDFPNIELP